MANHRAAPNSHLAPAEAREMFGRNLRILAGAFRSVSELCRQLGINRTQFNRYLSGESFPRPDVLHQICLFFEVDARILLEPLEDLATKPGVLDHPFIADHIGSGTKDLLEQSFPSGFYRFSRQSFIEPDLAVTGLVFVFRQDGYVFIRGYEARSAMQAQGLYTKAALREFRGVVTPHEDGVSFEVGHRNNMASTYNYLCRVAAFQNSFWVGYAARPCREAAANGRRVTRMVYEHLPGPFSEVLAAARATGYIDASDLPPFHQKHLNVGSPFT